MSNNVETAVFSRGTELRRDGFLVLGMHRSGTSAVAGTLAQIGVTPPRHLLGENEGNSRGHWESSVLIPFHDELLASAGTQWDDWRGFPEDWYTAPAAAEFRARGTAYLAEEFGGAATFVLKDPRICRFAPFWTGIFQSVGITPRILMPIRSPLEVAKSLKARNGFPLSKGLLLWLRHVLDAEATSRDLDRALFEWDAFLEDWHLVVANVGKTLGVRWPALSDLTAAQVSLFLDEDLKHQRVQGTDLESHPEVNLWVREVYAALIQLCREPASESARATLDDVRSRFNEAGLIFGGNLAAMEAAYVLRAESAERDRGAAEARLAAAEAERQSSPSPADPNAPQLAAQIEHLTAEFAQERAALQATSDSLRHARNCLSEELEVQRQGHDAQLSALNAEIAALSGAHAALQEAHRAALEQAAAAEAAYRDEIAALSASREAEAAAAAGDLAVAFAERDAASALLAENKAAQEIQVAAIDSQLERLKDEASAAVR